MSNVCPKCEANETSYEKGLIYECGSCVRRYDGQFYQSRDCLNRERDLLIAKLAAAEEREAKLLDVLKRRIDENGMGFWLNGYFAFKPQFKTVDEAIGELLK